jgi:hypothetical protein
MTAVPSGGNQAAGVPGREQTLAAQLGSERNSAIAAAAIAVRSIRSGVLLDGNSLPANRLTSISRVTYRDR